MSLEVLFDSIRQHFSPSQGQILIRSLQKDPLVWHFIQDEETCLPYITSVPKSLDAYAPAKIAAWLIQHETGVDVENLQNLETQLPEDLAQRVNLALESTLNSGLPPADLLTAGLLALALREKRIQKGNWQGISDEILIKGMGQNLRKNYQVWRTPFACLHHLCPDYDDLVSEILRSKTETSVSASIPIIVHSLLANPLDSQALLDQLYQFTQTLPIDHQLEALKWLGEFNQHTLRESLAKHLIQTKRNVDLFARVFAEVETFKTNPNGSDPLDKQVRYTLTEDLNRLAAFNYYSGNTQKASEIYHKSSELLGFMRSQTLFQSLASDPDLSTHANWLEIIKAVPESKQARLFYIHSLIEMRKFAEAEKYLKEMPDSSEKRFLESKIKHSKDPHSAPSKDLDMGIISADIDPRQITGYYAHQAGTRMDKDIVKSIIEDETSNVDTALVDKYLENHNFDPEIVVPVRDGYLKSHQYNKAIELTSFLDLAEPDEKTHQHMLAKLYCLAERWQDAYTHLQKVVKREASPSVENLENFAQAALKTDRVDMSISICQNILKESPHNTKALVCLGEAYMAKGDPVKAIQHMEQVVETIPDEAETWLTLAHIWEESGQTDRAFEILSKGILALPQNPKLMYALGKAHLERQSPADASIYLKKAFELEPENKEIKLNLAEAEYRLGKLEKAWTLLEPFMERFKQDPSTAKLLGHVLLAMDRKQAAEPILLFAAENFPEDLETTLTATHLALELIESSYEDADEDKLSQLQKVLGLAKEKNPYNEGIQLHLADLKRLNDHHQEAMNMYVALSETEQAQSKALDWRLSYGLGKAAVALGNHEMGLAALQEANKKQPGNLMVLHALAEAYQLADLREKSQKTAKSVLKLAPQDPMNILWYADFKTRYNEPDEAVKALKDALQIIPHRVDLKLWLVKSLIVNNAPRESKALLEELIADSKTKPDQLHKAAYHCVQINELGLSVQALEKSNQLSTEPNPILLMDLAQCYALLGQQMESLETLDLSDDLFERYPQLALLKSDLLCESEQYDLAYSTLRSVEASAEKALSDGGKNIPSTKSSPLLYTHDFSLKGYTYRLGLLQRAEGEIKESQSTLAKALAQNPEDIQIMNACAAAYAAGIDFENALAVCTEMNGQETNYAQNNQDRLDLICTQAEIYLYQDEIDSALNLLQDSAISNSSYPRLLALKSRLAFAQGEIENAQAYLDSAYQSYEKDWEAGQSASLDETFQQAAILTAIAEAGVELEDYQQAIQLYSQTSTLFSDQPLFNWRYAEAMVKAAQTQQIANLVSVTAHAPGASMLSEENYLLCQEKIEKCKAFLSEDQWICLNAQSIAVFSGEWPLNLNVDACLINSEIAATVIINCQDETFVKDILDTYAEDIHILQAYGLHALRYGNDDGTTYIEKALQMDVSNPINHALLALLNWQEPDLALNSLESALQFWPEESEWHALAGELYTLIGDTEAASHHIQHALEGQPENADFWQMSADIQLKNNDLEQAKAALVKSASIQSKNPQIWVKMSGINQQMGNHSEAIENLHTAAALAPEDKNVALQEVSLLLDQENFSEAENKASEILGSDAANGQAQIYLAQSRAKQAKFDAALKGLALAAEKDPDNPNLRLESIKIKKVQEGAEAALPELIALAQDHPDNPDILTTLTDLLIQTNRLEEAEETAQTILRIIPGQAEVHLMLGRLQRKSGKLDQAITHLSEAIHNKPNYIEAYLELGKTYQERRNLEEAIKVFQEGSKANSSDPRPYFHAGMALKDCKDYPAAETMLKLAKKYAPNDANIIRQLGVVTALNLINNLQEAR